MKLLFEGWRKFLIENEEAQKKKLSQNPEIGNKAAFNTILAQDAFKDDAAMLSEGVELPQLEIGFEISDPASPDNKIVDRFVESLYSGKRSGFLTYYTPEEFLEMRLFLLKGNKAGFAIKEDGDIVSVHNNSPLKGLSTLFLDTAKKNGGTKLDHFDGFLTGLYKKHGFQNIYQVYQWDEQYKPDTWEFPATDIFNPNTSVYADSITTLSYYKKEQSLKVDNDTTVLTTPYDKALQYKYGRPDVIFRKL